METYAEKKLEKLDGKKNISKIRRIVWYRNEVYLNASSRLDISFFPRYYVGSHSFGDNYLNLALSRTKYAIRNNTKTEWNGIAEYSRFLRRWRDTFKAVPWRGIKIRR